MAQVYDDFDKRAEHDRRFNELGGKSEIPAYTAPTKRRCRDKSDEDFSSAVQSSLPDDLLGVTPIKRR